MLTLVALMYDPVYGRKSRIFIWDLGALCSAASIRGFWSCVQMD